MPTPEKAEQIIQTHSSLILAVVQTIHNPDFKPHLEPILQQSAQNGWQGLVNIINKIIDGNRDQALVNNLDDEDAVIIDSILRGLQDPETLPKTEQVAGDATKAAPMFARLIDEARCGNTNSLTILGGMAEQMVNAGGDMASLSAVLKNMVDGERDVDKLCTRMGPQGESLITQILSELAKLDLH
ncbi:hypothetical protein MNBD_GAMMA06-828 [hydrothermal vent metagenome]|uniref:Uncharacterized protein n=1 Tax=hydrothermal vent metagenome TaxID=652676 RepID=A0A3B0WP67_9ZZZZ